LYPSSSCYSFFILLQKRYDTFGLLEQTHAAPKLMLKVLGLIIPERLLRT
jgi:hypothetical protein